MQSSDIHLLASERMDRSSLVVIVVGQRQPGSQRLKCNGCRRLLEYLHSDLRIADGLSYLDCPVKGCRFSNYLGSQQPAEKKKTGRPPAR